MKKSDPVWAVIVLVVVLAIVVPGRCGEEQEKIDCETVRAMMLPKDAKIEGVFGVGNLGNNRVEWFVTYSLASQKALPYEAIGFEGRVQITDSVVHCFEEVEP